LWTWGDNFRGAAGNNRNVDVSTPVTTILGGNDWAKVTSGIGYIAAIKTNGSLWVWGDNRFAQLGINNTIDKSTPVTTFLGGNNWKTVGGGFQTLTAITSGFNVDLS
jgi:alpha-tubulin suppressor-like RCC1 family protein